jgi:hypothetical protein
LFCTKAKIAPSSFIFVVVVVVVVVVGGGDGAQRDKDVRGEEESVNGICKK